MKRGSRHDNMLQCPFCSRTIDEPAEIKTGFGSSFTGGKCECGAVYVYDRGGHNLGEAYVDAMAYACNGDWDKAWSLVPDEDYEVRELSFDSRRNKFSGMRRGVTPTFMFISIKT
jgi:hypothetical protein